MVFDFFKDDKEEENLALCSPLPIYGVPSTQMNKVELSEALKLQDFPRNWSHLCDLQKSSQTTATIKKELLRFRNLQGKWDVADMDARRLPHPDYVQMMAQTGLMGMELPEELGGPGLTMMDKFHLMHLVGYMDLALAWILVQNLGNVDHPFLLFGPDHLVLEWGPRIASGQVFGSYAQSEPYAGSDVKALTMYAKPMPQDKYRIDGYKHYIGSGNWSDFMIVFAKASEDPNNFSMTCFFTETNNPGVYVGPEHLTWGLKPAVQNKILFKNCIVEKHNMIGSEGMGFEVGDFSMGYTRIGMCCANIGSVQKVMQIWNDSATSLPHTFRSIVTCGLSFEQIAAALARALEADSQGVPYEISALAKSCTADFCWHAVELAWEDAGRRVMQTGTTAPGLARLLGDARIVRIFEGPTEALIAHVGKLLSAGTFYLERMVGWFKKHFNNPPAVGDLLKAIDEAKALFKENSAKFRPMFDSPKEYMSLQHAFLGFLASVYIVPISLGTLEDSHPLAKHAKECADQVAKNALLHVKSLPFESTVISSKKIPELLEGFQLEIGDIDQIHAGEDWDYDPMLRRNFQDIKQSYTHLQTKWADTAPVKTHVYEGYSIHRHEKGAASTFKLLQALRGFGEHRVYSRLADERGLHHPHVYLELAKMGLFGIQIPKDKGGLGLKYVDSMAVFQQLGALDSSLAVVLAYAYYFGTHLVFNHGTEECKKATFERLRRGLSYSSLVSAEKIGTMTQDGNFKKSVGIRRSYVHGWMGATVCHESR
jgi:alkylation response protein AidB-like acyl-CoA dehydrogenase